MYGRFANRPINKKSVRQRVLLTWERVLLTWEQGLPVARYDKAAKRAYLENAEGSKEFVDAK